DKYVSGVVDYLTLAGAKVTGRVQVQDKFTEPSENEDLLDVASLSRPATVVGLPTNSNGVETSTALLAALLLDRVPQSAEDARTRVAAGYEQRKYIVVTGTVTGVAEAIVVVAGPPYVDRDAAKKNAAVVTMVTGLDQKVPIVVAGNGTSGDG